MLAFFDKFAEVQNAPKTEKTVDLRVDMTNYSQPLNNEKVEIVRDGKRQFLTYIYVGKAYHVIPKTSLNNFIRKINR